MTDAPDTPDTRTQGQPRPIADVIRLVQPPTARLLRGGWQLETRWYECLLYPFRAGYLLLVLAALLAGLTGGAALLLPDLLVELRTAPEWVYLPAAVPFLVPLLVMAYACAFLQCTLSAATAGEARHVRWPGHNLALVVRNSGMWLVCFFTGPAWIVAATLRYWVSCGDLELLDWVILTELSTLAFGGWLFALAAVNSSGRLRDANPVSAARTALRLGYRALLISLCAGALMLGHFAWTLRALELLHSSTGLGWLLLGCVCISGLLWATFVFRLLGVWFHRTR